MKFIYSLFLTSFVFITTGSNMALSSFGSISDSNSSNYISNERYSNLSNQTEVEDKYSNTTLPAILSANKDEDRDY